MRDGAWLVSLEFPIAGQGADIEQVLPDGRSLWAYRLPFAPLPGAAAAVPRQA